jgi:pimeloyl-ACP methyl ester carboxylesterase
VTATAWNVPDFKLVLSNASPNPEEPLIFVPGIGGTHLVDKSQDPPGDVWPGFLKSKNPQLTLNPPNPNIIATDAIRFYQPIPLLGTWTERDVYGTLLETTLKASGGYHEYLVNNDPALRTTTGCDLYQRPKEPNLFVFAYDWRKSNEENAGLLRDYVGCVQRFHPSVKVNILAHSQGGLIARRYILDNPGKTDKLITIATPWLGAPKMIYALETGDAKFSRFIISQDELKELVKYFPSTHELLPSRWYFDLGGRPFREVGDFDGNGVANETYTYNQLSTLLDKRYKDSKPAKTGSIFHDHPGQDDWRNDQTGVEYHIIYGQQKVNTTIGQVIAENSVVCGGLLPMICQSKEKFNVAYLPGDGTVPVRSAWRHENSQDLAPNAYKWKYPSYSEATDPDAEHNGLPKTPWVRAKVLYLLGRGPDPDWIDIAEVIPGPSYYLNFTGLDFVSISDELGNQNTAIDDTFALPVPGLTYDVTGEHSIAITLSPDKNYTIRFQNGPDPIAFEVVKGVDKETVTEAVRYQDLTLPPEVNAMLQTSPQGITDLRYDSDGDGTFDTVVEPTARLAGSPAQDMNPPTLNIDMTKNGENQIITITAEDTNAGLKGIYYSLDGTTFQAYTNPFTVTPSQASYVYAFADDNAGNRSSMVKRRLPIRSALLVTGSSTLTASDLFISTRLQDLGYSVTVKSAESSLTTDATATDLVVISSTVEPSIVNSKFRDVAAGVITWDEGMFPYLGMTGSVAGTDFGRSEPQTEAIITPTSNPLAAGLTGTVTISTFAAPFAWAKPNANAAKIATLQSDPDKAVVFGYESGTSMPGLAAPGRRVGLGMADDTAEVLSADGWALFDSAANWAGGLTNNAPTISITSPANNANFAAGSNISITADAADSDGVIRKVDFYAGSTLLGTSTNSPYSFTWNNTPSGNYALTTVATDDSGTATVSSVVAITINAASGTLAGTVTQVNGTIPIVGARIDVKNGSTLIATTTTNGVGSYAISGVALGTYDVLAGAEGYSSQTQTGVVINSGTTTAVDFYLNYSVPTNVALSGTASQSSTAYGGVAGRAVDGNTSGNWGDNSVTHTTVENQPWWQVDLGSLQPIQEVKLWNRTDCCGDALADFYLFVSDQPFESTDLQTTQNQSSVTTYHMGGIPGTSTTMTIQRTARYLRVQLGRNDRLSLAEVQIWAGILTPPSNPSNLALNRPTVQSDTLWGGYSSRAVDGNTSGNWSDNSVTHTAVQNNAWWQVDLGNVKSLQTVQLSNRTDCCGDALSNFYVFVSDVPFASTDLSATQNQTGVWSSYFSGQVGGSTTITVNRTGRYLRVQLAGNDRLSLAEVQVLGEP